MKSTTKKLSDAKVELKVTLDAKDLAESKSKAVEKLAKDLNVKGFRKGKAPASFAEKHLSPNDIANETANIAIHRSLQESTKDMERVIGAQRVNVTKFVPDGTLEYTTTIEIVPDIKIGDFKKLKAKMSKVEPTKAEIQEIVDNIVAAKAEKKAVKRAAKTGDEVIIDFVGKKDDKAFDGGSAKDYALLLGSGQFIPGFEEGIVGHEPGDKFNLELTFPKEYPSKNLAGQKTVFEVLLKQVNELVKPKEDEKLAKECGFKSMTELKDDIKRNLEAQNRHKAVEEYRENLVRELVEKTKVEAPEILVEDQLRQILSDVERNASSYGMKLEEYLEHSKQTLEEFQKTTRELAEKRVKSMLVLQKLAVEQKIQATDQEVEAKIAELRDLYQKSAEAMANLAKPEVRDEIKARLTIDKAIDFIVDANDGDPAAKNKATSAKPKSTKKK